MVATLVHPFDLEFEVGDTLDLFAEELPEQLSPLSDCLSSASSVSSISCCAGSFSCVGSVISCG
ncbi:MAG: thiocillin family RiPP [Dehalococcoidia bacterium]|nr:thiocillin family RiPP [Dehalococcoidia bacterium]